MRVTIMVLTLMFILGAVAIRWGVWHWSPSNALWSVAAIGMIRIALVLIALWIAWPTIRRPAMWMPPGLAAVTLIAIGACVVQPRLAIAVFPLLGALIALAGFVRFFREK
jgi:hypothetical protein